MYNASDVGLNAQINVNTNKDNKGKVKSNFITSCLALKGFTPMGFTPNLKSYKQRYHILRIKK